MEQLAHTGIAGLDDILTGGLPANRMYLIQGPPGAGKTTLALQFLQEGVRRAEQVLFVALSETAEELGAVARSHGWSLDGIHVYEVTEDAGQQAENTFYNPADVELGERLRDLLATIERLRPRRLVIDSCSELRLLAQTPLRFRQQILAIKRDLIERGCTVLLLDNPLLPGGDVLLQSLVHGVIELENLAPPFGAERRRLRVAKLRQIAFRGGFHDFTLRTGGLAVFPRIVAAEHHVEFRREAVASGDASLDALLGGGIDRGTSTLVIGTAGSGKSALATTFAVAAARARGPVFMFAFDELYGTLLARARALGVPVYEAIAAGRLTIRQIDPAEMSPGEFAHTLRTHVERDGARVIVIDSLNGYVKAMPDETSILLQLHELLAYLGQLGVATLLVVSQVGADGRAIDAPIDVSYLADTVIVTRTYQSGGRMRRAISVVKKRTSAHEDAVRELLIGAGGVRVGEIVLPGDDS